MHRSRRKRFRRHQKLTTLFKLSPGRGVGKYGTALFATIHAQKTHTWWDDCLCPGLTRRYHFFLGEGLGVATEARNLHRDAGCTPIPYIGAVIIHVSSLPAGAQVVIRNPPFPTVPRPAPNGPQKFGSRVIASHQSVRAAARRPLQASFLNWTKFREPACHKSEAMHL